MWKQIRTHITRNHLVGAVVLLGSLGGGGYYLQSLGLGGEGRLWLFLPLVLMSLLAFSFYACLTVGGYALLRRIVPVSELPTAETLLHSMTIGLGLFALTFYLLGALGGLGSAYAVVFPVGMFALGARDLPELWTRFQKRLAEARPSGRLGSWILSRLALGWGAGLLLLLYATSLTPKSFNFDAIWYHIPVAQDYARLGRIVPFYGDNHRAYPQLTSLIHTWALLVPGIKILALRWILMLQLELLSVVWRIVGAVAVARWCLGGRRIPGLWVVFFLFPSVFIYDQNIAGSADHVLGMTAAPLFLAVARMILRMDVRFAILGGVAAGCHILTKYQAIYLVVATFCVVGGRAVWLLLMTWRHRKGSGPSGVKAALRGPLVLAGVALLVSSPHFIKNIVFYDNPLYPFASSVFPSSFEERQNSNHEQKQKKHHATGPGIHQSVDTGVLGHAGLSALVDARHVSGEARAKAKNSRPSSKKRNPDGKLYDFQFRSRSYSFEPQGDSWVEKWVWAHRTMVDWPFSTGNRHLTQGRPYMGALFVLLLPFLLLLRKKKRLLFAVGFSYFAFLTWALTNANDRYLLSFLTIPIGITAALLVRLWRLGSISRVALILLVGIQVLISTETPFVYADKRLKDTATLFKRAQGKGSLERALSYHGSGQRLTRAFPPDARVLTRYFKAHLGFDRSTFNTHRAIQRAIDFSRLKNPRDLWQICTDLGITHLLYPEGKRRPVAAQNVLLVDALAAISEDRKKVAGNVIARLTKEPPSNTKPFLVLVRGVREYRDGLYEVSDLSADERKKRPSKRRPLAKYSSKNLDSLLERADGVFMSGKKVSEKKLKRDFKRVERFGRVTVWLRKKPRHGGPAEGE